MLLKWREKLAEWIRPKRGVSKTVASEKGFPVGFERVGNDLVMRIPGEPPMIRRGVFRGVPNDKPRKAK